jgi:hypothetical protein
MESRENAAMKQTIEMKLGSSLEKLSDAARAMVPMTSVRIAAAKHK